VKNLNNVKPLSILLLLLLIVQYVLGMLVNLLVNFNGVFIAGSSFFEKAALGVGYASTAGWMLEAHLTVAPIIIILAIILIVIGAREKELWLWVRALSLVLMFVIAGLTGAAFVGYQNSYYSLAMALAFLVAFGIAMSLCF
jgi:hypothetical protein